MKIVKIGKALSSKTRLRILNLLDEKELSAIETYRRYKDKFNSNKHRETIYRELEKLVEANLVNKKYEDKNKKIIYSLKARKIEIDVLEKKVNME